MKNIAISQIGGTKQFLLGSWQATLEFETGGWLARYYFKNKFRLGSKTGTHPALPSMMSGEVVAVSIVCDVLRSLERSGKLPSIIKRPEPVPTPAKRRTRRPKVWLDPPAGVNATPIPAKRPPRRVKKVVTAQMFIQKLLDEMNSNWNLLVPTGKPEALSRSKVRVVDPQDQIICEISYPAYMELMKS